MHLPLLGSLRRFWGVGLDADKDDLIWEELVVGRFFEVVGAFCITRDWLALH